MRDVLRVIAIGLVIAAAGCGAIESDYVPTDDTFQRRVGTFILDGAVGVEPTYGNVDVDSVLGKYTVSSPSADDVLAEIENRAVRSGWTLQKQRPKEYEFHRPTTGVRPSYEIVRVVAKGQRPVIVHVAWLQMDAVATSTEAAKSVEWKWAAREFWPRFERHVEAR